MNNALFDTAYSLYNVFGRDSAINFLKANLKITSGALAELIDLINYVADIEERYVTNWDDMPCGDEA